MDIVSELIVKDYFIINDEEMLLEIYGNLCPYKKEGVIMHLSLFIDKHLVASKTLKTNKLYLAVVSTIKSAEMKGYELLTGNKPLSLGVLIKMVKTRYTKPFLKEHRNRTLIKRIRE